MSDSCESRLQRDRATREMRKTSDETAAALIYSSMPAAAAAEH